MNTHVYSTVASIIVVGNRSNTKPTIGALCWRRQNVLYASVGT